MKIVDMTVHDVRFPTSKTLAGSDAVHKDPDYSCVYLVLRTDDANVPEAYGFTFSLGRGNEIICAAVEALKHVVVGKDFEEDILKDMMNADQHCGFYYQL
jgi:L-fuconate dehydratase